MKKYFFHINHNRRARVVEFYFGEDKKNGKEFLNRAEKLVLNFDDVILQVQILNDSVFEAALNPVLNKMLNAFRMKKGQSSALTNALKKAREKHKDNLVFPVCVNVLENEYHSILEKMCFREHYQFGIPVSSSVIEQSQNQLRLKYHELHNSLRNFADNIDKGFCCSLKDTFIQLGRTIIWYDGKNFQMCCDLSNGIEALIFFITRHVASYNLRVFRCSNCGKNFLNTSNRKYCSSPECQHVHKLDLEKQERLERKKNCYLNLLDGYYAYVRQVKRILTCIRVVQSDMGEFEVQQKKCADVIKNAIYTYRSEQKPIDDELLNLVKTNRTIMKETTNSIRSRYFK